MTVFVNPQNVSSDCNGPQFSGGLVVRDNEEHMVETILLDYDGNFETPAGKVRVQDLGLYVLRLLNHPAARNYDRDVV